MCGGDRDVPQELDEDDDKDFDCVELRNFWWSTEMGIERDIYFSRSDRDVREMRKGRTCRISYSIYPDN